MAAGFEDGGMALRRELRRFLRAETARGAFDPREGSLARFDAGFAARLGARGFIGVDWPRALGGLGGSVLDRHIIAEELLAHGAPVRAHWAAEWLAGPLLLRAGTPEQQRELLPRIAAGRLSLCLGMGEAMPPAAMTVRARAVGGGWRLGGRLFPVEDAAEAQRLILLARTAAPAEGSAGLTLFLVDLALPGVSVRALPDLAGGGRLAEVVLQEVFLAADRVIGAVDAGLAPWKAVMRAAWAAPHHWMAGHSLLAGLLDGLGTEAPAAADAAIGRLVAGLYALHATGLEVAGRGVPATTAALLAEAAADHAATVPEAVHGLLPEEGPSPELSLALLTAASDAARAPRPEARRRFAARRLRPSR